MFFSVIIPTYNRLEFLKEAISSVLKQTFQDFELIIIDDASDDETAVYLASLNNSNIKYVINNKNNGVSYSRNIGIQLSRGKYIAFLDSDDLWDQIKLKEQYSFFIQNPKIRICHTNENWIRNGIHLNQSKHHKKQEGFFFERATHLCLVSPSSVVLQKEIFAEFGLFDEDLDVCEDYDLWLRLNAFLYFGFIDKPLVSKRGGHKDQLSSKLPAMDYYRIRSMKKLLDLNVLTSVQNDILKRTIKTKLKVLYKGALKHNNTRIITYCENLSL